eukprot:gene20547-27337_t
MVEFGKYLLGHCKPEWKAYYLDYKGLKTLIKESANDVDGSISNFSPRTTSLTVQKFGNKKNSAEECFFAKLEQDVTKVNKFTLHLVEDLRSALTKLNSKAQASTSEKDQSAPLLAEAKRIGDDFLALEKFVNLNYLGFHKILKKHDKLVPHAPCRQFYISHLHQQPWVQGNYSDLLVTLSGIYSKLRGDATGEKNEDSAQGFVRSTTKYWVRNEDVSTVKHHVLQHLPVFQFDTDKFSGDAQLINSVYLDNASWYGPEPRGIVFVERKTHRESWKGECSVKERFVITADRVVPFLDGEYKLDEAISGEYKLEEAISDMQAAAAKRSKTVSPEEIDSFTELFTEIYNAIDAKQLKPWIRTQYMRTAFQIPFDSTVRVSLDTNMCMIKENPEDGPTCAVTGRWYRDPALPVHRTEITRFPHAILEVKLSLSEGQTSPSWVQDLLDSGYLTEVHKFSKFIHGTATLFPEMVRAVPYWVDDESVRASMIASAPLPEEAASYVPPAITPDRSGSKPRVDAPKRSYRSPDDDLNHPLLGDEPTLKMMPDPDEVRGFVKPTEARRGSKEPNFWLKLFGLAPPAKMARALPQKIEPKTFFANERTFLAWLHMSVTIGSISAALLGFASSKKKKESGAAAAISQNLVELIALILLPLGMAMVIYALYIFTWRASSIAKKKAVHFDDRVGPLGLCAAVVLALIAIFFLACIDFWEAAHASDSPAPPSLTLGMFDEFVGNLQLLHTVSRFVKIADAEPSAAGYSENDKHTCCSDEEFPTVGFGLIF